MNDIAALKLAYDLGWSNFFARREFFNPYLADIDNKLELYKNIVFRKGFKQAEEYDTLLKGLGY